MVVVVVVVVGGGGVFEVGVASKKCFYVDLPLQKFNHMFLSHSFCLHKSFNNVLPRSMNIDLNIS